jgi:hypothetical protein
VHGRSELIHIAAQRKGFAILQIPQGKEKFEWSEEADNAFAKLKQFLTSPLVLMAPKEGKTLLLYIATTNRVVSTAIVVEREEVGHVHKV